MMPPRTRPIVAEVIVRPITPKQVVLLGEALGVGGARAVPADQRDRARDQPEHGMQAEQLGEQQAKRILHQQEGKKGEQEAYEPRAAAPQQREIRGQADRGEEQQEERRLGAGVEGKAQAPRPFQQQRRHGKQQAADDRRRDAEARQHCDAFHQQVAHDQHQAAGQERGKHRQRQHDRHGASPGYGPTA
jgi:hypothetical protein